VKVSRLSPPSPSTSPTACTIELARTSPSSPEPQGEVGWGAAASLSGRMEADLVLWTAGSAPATKGEGGPRKGLPFPTNAKGSIQTVGPDRNSEPCKSKMFYLMNVSILVALPFCATSDII
jgi:hypothetical protein